MPNGISAESAAARRANEMRYAQMMNIYNQVIARAQPGGAFEKAGLTQIETAKTKGVGEEMQQMISSGMYGTTTAAGVPARWEAEIGAPARLRLEDIMERRLTEAQLGKAGAIERREDVYPDVGAYAEYERMAAQTPQQSLSDWMAQEFGTISGGVRRPTPTAAPARKTTPAYQPTAPAKAAPTKAKPTGGYTIDYGYYKSTPGRVIPAQTTPVAMEEYLKTYTPQVGDVSMVPPKKKKPVPSTGAGYGATPTYLSTFYT